MKSRKLQYFKRMPRSVVSYYKGKRWEEDWKGRPRRSFNAANNKHRMVMIILRLRQKRNINKKKYTDTNHRYLFSPEVLICTCSYWIFYYYFYYFIIETTAERINSSNKNYTIYRIHFIERGRRFAYCMINVYMTD